VSADENPVSLMIEHDGKSYILCTLQHGKHFQQPLNLEFASGEEMTFFVKGKGSCHILLPCVLEFEMLFLLHMCFVICVDGLIGLASVVNNSF